MQKQNHKHNIISNFTRHNINLFFFTGCGGGGDSKPKSEIIGKMYYVYNKYNKKFKAFVRFQKVSSINL